FHRHSNFLGEVAVGDGGGHGGDVAHLGGEVAGHAVDGVGQIFPRAGDALHFGLATSHDFRAHFAGDASYFGGEGGELIHHGVDHVLDLEDFAFHVDHDFLGQVTGGNGGCDFRHVAKLHGEV